MLTGNPARVEDAEKGTSESKRLTVYLREDRVVSDARPLAAVHGARPHDAQD